MKVKIRKEKKRKEKEKRRESKERMFYRAENVPGHWTEPTKSKSLGRTKNHH